MSDDNERKELQPVNSLERKLKSASIAGGFRTKTTSPSFQTAKPSPSPARQATQVDAGWRQEAAAPARQATQVDAGWRQEAVAPARQATQVDAGWRQEAVAPARQATQVDAGWRQEAAAPARQATQVDAGWRNNTSDTNQDESINTGWNTSKSDVYHTSKIGGSWRENVEETLRSVAQLNKKTDNHFPHIEQFKEAVANLPELRSITGNAYPVKRTLSDKGGEAMVLLCASPDGTDVVAKVYYELNDPSDNYIIPRANVLKFMGTEEGKRYTLAISEIGFVEFGNSQYLFEIMPYCRSTDLSDDGAYSFDQIVDVAKQMNELLHSIHNVGICHLDIKPENMYMFDGQIKLGDFGIARNAANNRSNMTVHIMGTEGYRAPEATRYIFGPASDYYSLGVTLASLFEGHFIFENMNYEMQVKALENERVPLTKMDPHREQLENLLNGLVRINPRQRFGYDDVKRWIEDHNYIGGVQSDEWPKSFRLLNDIYKDEKSMFFGITKDSEHWDMAKKMLYGNIIEPFFSSFRTDLAMAAKSVNELYRSSNGDKGLAVFLKSLYKPGPIVWRGHHFYSLGELGARMLVTKNQAGYSELLKNNCVSHWLTNTEGISKNNDTLELVNSIEMLANSAPELACYWFGNSFASERELNICNRTVKTIDELIKTLFSSNSNFFQLGGYEKLMNRVDGADLYGFLYSFGYKDIIDAEWQNVKELPTYESTVVLMSMMDVIAVKAGADAGIVRSFFINYGPVGIARYVKKLTEENVYSPLDFEGKQIIEKVTNCSTPKEGTVDQLYKAYLPLIDSVRKMQSKLIENPHCIISGMYETKGIICKNLAGCFAFKIYDRLAPLGFSYLIESNNGGV